MNLNWDRALRYAAVAGTALIAWKKLGPSTKGELKLRAAAAGSTLLGNPVAYRVTLLKGGTGPGIAVSTGPSLISHCTVVGVQGDGMYLGVQGDPWVPGSPDDEPEDECEGQDDAEDEEDDTGTDETAYRPNVAPAACENGHLSYPAAVMVHDDSEYRSHSAVRLGQCPECGAARAIPAGTYRAGYGGRVFRAGPAGEAEEAAGE